MVMCLPQCLAGIHTHRDANTHTHTPWHQAFWQGSRKRRRALLLSNCEVEEKDEAEEGVEGVFLVDDQMCFEKIWSWNTCGKVPKGHSLTLLLSCSLTLATSEAAYQQWQTGDAAGILTPRLLPSSSTTNEEVASCSLPLIDDFLLFWNHGQNKLVRLWLAYKATTIQEQEHHHQNK